MTKVRCVKCGNVQDAWGRWFFSCNSCGEKQIIENSIHDPVKTLEGGDNNQTGEPLNNSLENTQEAKEEERTEPQSDESKALDSSSSDQVPKRDNDPSPPFQEEETLEIEEEDPSPEKENYNCPNCNAEINKFGDCQSCGSEIIWGTE
jgi:predicted RNA-binding Zn-ribbon protein involved in translation (DUF1610 family)